MNVVRQGSPWQGAVGWGSLGFGMVFFFRCHMNDFDERAVSEIHPADDDRRHGCLTLRERDAGLVLIVVLAIGLVVLGCLVLV